MDFIRMRLKNMYLEEAGLLQQDLFEKYLDKYMEEPIPIRLGKLGVNRAAAKPLGDRLMLTGEFEVALVVYTKGLQDCRPMSFASMSYYLSRSKTLEKLECYKESISDLERALQICNSKEIGDTLRKQKTILEEKLSRAKPTETSSKGVSKSRAEIPKLTHGENNEVPGAGNSIRVAYDAEYGRHFVAASPIKIGDVILIEKPRMVSPMHDDDDDYEDLLCHHCLAYSRAPVPCDFCSVALFCSEKCRKEAYDTYHKVECSFSVCTDNVKVVLRLLLNLTDNGAKFEEAKEYCKELDERTTGSTNATSPDVSVESELKSTLDLTASINARNFMELQPASVGVATLLRNYSNYTGGSNDLLGLAKLIFRLLYVVQVYGVKLTLAESDKVAGVAVYPLFNLVYHSCCANTIYTVHDGNVLVLRAASDIAPGEKITYNFMGPGVLNLSAAERRDYILMKRNIICKCEACMANYEFKPELRKKIDIPMQLKRRLRKSAAGVSSMWTLLELIHNEIKRPCLELELMKFSLADAYMQKGSSAIWSFYKGIGVF